ncbi:MAG: cupin domain-containing protein [Bacillota bacterium]
MTPENDEFNPDDFVSACDLEAAPAGQAGSGPAAAAAPAGQAADRAPSRFLTFQPPFSWDAVARQPYKVEGAGFAGVDRHVLFGPGDSTAFHVRYFELAPGGYSSLEKHRHAHAVICARGCGLAVVGTEVRPMNPMDAVYVSPMTPHQFINESEEPFGFFCIVDADRDRPQPVSREELAALRANPAVARAIRLK